MFLHIFPVPCEARGHTCILFTVIESHYSENSYLSSPINKCIHVSMSEAKRHNQSILPIKESELYTTILQTGALGCEQRTIAWSRV